METATRLIQYHTFPVVLVGPMLHALSYFIFLRDKLQKNTAVELADIKGGRLVL